MLMPIQKTKKHILVFMVSVFIFMNLHSCMFRLDFEIKQSEIIKFAEDNGIQYDEIYYLSADYTANYLAFCDNIDSTGNSRHSYHQPIQTLYYDKQDSLISFNCNCFSPGMLPLTINWNRDGLYDVFPPKDNIYSMPARVCKDSLISYLTPVLYSKKYIDTVDYDYTVFILGGLVFEGMTEEAIEAVDKNIALDSSKSKIKRYFVITDEFFEDSYTIIK